MNDMHNQFEHASRHHANPAFERLTTERLQTVRAAVRRSLSAVAIESPRTARKYDLETQAANLALQPVSVQGLMQRPAYEQPALAVQAPAQPDAISLDAARQARISEAAAQAQLHASGADSYFAEHARYINDLTDQEQTGAAA